jgi:Fic family protein
MKIPQIPPSWLGLYEETAHERRSEIHKAGKEWAFRDKYLHWNELRRKPAPKGFSHKEWWFALKLARTGSYRPIGLFDKRKAPFVFGQPNALNELLHQIDRGLGLIVGLPDALAEPSARDRYVVNTLIEESITSSQLEGAATTRVVAKELLRTGRKPRDKSEHMILNNFRTMSRIRDLKGVDLTPELILELHSRITEGTLDKPDAEGRLRRADENVRVVDDIEGTEFHVPPPAEELPARLAAMCAFANGTAPDYFIHPVIRGIILHFWLAYDHPFYDGNGRTARALFYWSMLRQEYQLFEFISISEILLRSPKKYAEAFLHTETDENDLTYFILHQADVIREAVNSLRGYLRSKAEELRTAGKCLQGIEDLNHRQQALLVHALREPSTTYLIAGHQRSHGVTHQTARDDLFDLVERGLLVVHRHGRGYRFRVPGDLSGKLSKLAGAEPRAQEDDTLLLEMPSSTAED